MTFHVILYILWIIPQLHPCFLHRDDHKTQILHKCDIFHVETWFVHQETHKHTSSSHKHITAPLSYSGCRLSETSSLITSVSLEMAVVLSHLIGSPDCAVDFDASFAIGVYGARLGWRQLERVRRCASAWVCVCVMWSNDFWHCNEGSRISCVRVAG